MNQESLVSKTKQEDDKFKIKAALFLGTVASASAFAGFARTISTAKKSDPQYFDKGIVGTRTMQESGATLAMRALGWGTFYAIAGCGILFYGIWKLSGAENLQDFRMKCGRILPAIPKNDPPQGRTEFSGLNDLMEYVSTLKSANDK